MHPKSLFAVLCCLVASACVAETTEPGAEPGPAGPTATQNDAVSCRNALAPTEEKTALKLIDDICGDTWCEGDNNFAFDHLTCRAGAGPTSGTCTLRFRILPRDDSGRSFARTCTTGGFTGFASLVDTAQSGYQSLNWDYYLALTDCISALESELPR